MSIIGVGLNLLLAVMLAAALGMGWRLNRRLAVLRESHEGFAKAVADLDVAAQRAEQGLADLRAATDEATDLLADRIEKARALTQKLERLTVQRPAAEPAAQPAKAVPAGRAAQAPAPVRDLELELDRPLDASRLGALLGAARAATARPARLEPQPLPRREAPVQRLRAPDDDLFDELPARTPISAMLGARR
jgi:hypothetical protein